MVSYVASARHTKLSVKLDFKDKPSFLQALQKIGHPALKARIL